MKEKAIYQLKPIDRSDFIAWDYRKNKRKSLLSRMIALLTKLIRN